MILVTGATGTVGSQVLRLLEGTAVRAMTRNPESGFRADYDDPDSLRRAVDGVSAVFLVTVVPPTPTARHDLALLEAAADAGVKRIVKLSAIGTGEIFEGRTVGAWHAEAEAAIQAGPFRWTVLRPCGFASNVLWYKDSDHLVDMVGGARQGVIDPRDIAAVAVAALTDDVHHGQTYTLTGPELLSVADQAAILTEELGRPYSTVEAEAPAGEFALGAAWGRAGHAEVLTDTVERVTGRAPGPFRDWVRAHRQLFDGS